MQSMNVQTTASAMLRIAIAILILIVGLLACSSSRDIRIYAAGDGTIAVTMCLPFAACDDVGAPR